MKSQNNNDPLKPYARYSGMAAQMIFIIAGGSFGGYKLDQWIDIGFPVFTVILSLGSVFLAIWLFIKELNTKNNNEN